MARNPKTPETPELPGTEGEVNEKIDGLARHYCSARDDRMTALEIEVELKSQLITAMKAEGMTSYKHKDISIVLTTKDSIKVKADGSESDDEEPPEE